MSPAASSWLPFAGVCLLYLCFLAFLGRRYWKSFQASAPGRTFSYRITDIWAAMVALTPTTIIVVLIADRPEPSQIIICAILGVSQAFGIIIGKLGFGRSVDRQGAIGSAIDVILGGLFGIGVLVGFCFVLIPVAMSVSLQVMLGILVVCYGIVHVLTRKK